MSITRDSITFKTMVLFVVSLTFFIVFVLFATKYIFSSSYKDLMKEKMSVIEKSIAPSLSLNLSYQFSEAVQEIGEQAILNKDILLLKVESSSSEFNIVFSDIDGSISDFQKSGEFVSSTRLTDPSTGFYLGDMTIVYSKDSYDKYMSEFYAIFMVGAFLFLMLIVILSYFLSHSLKPLGTLALSLKEFDPYNPKKIDLKDKRDSEINSISTSANIMIDNILKFIDQEQDLKDKILQKETHLKDAQTIANIGSWEYNSGSKSLTLSEEMCNMLSIDKNLKIDYDTFLNYTTGEDYYRVLTAFDDAIEQNLEFELEYKISLKSLKVLYVKTKGHIVTERNGEVIITAVTLNITQEVKNKQIIERLAYYDALTGVANRLLLKDRINKAIQKSLRDKTQMAVIFLDLDHFKLINDTLGHEVGDKLLIYVSNLLKEQIRESDTLARIGGDEFVILLPHIDSKSGAEFIANKIVQALQPKHNIGTHQLFVTTSVGVSMYPKDGTSVDALIKSADTAMYDAKNSGRNSFRFYEKDMGSYINKQLELEQDLAEAISSEDQIEVYFQPKILTHDGSLYGAEALVRWNHPVKGLVFPDEFIFIAESTGLMIELGNVIIEKSIAQAKEWHDHGFENLKVAINLSSRQFQDGDMTSFILRMIKKYDVNPANLEFEITENLSMSNMAQTQTILNNLSNIGLSIAIDDFGTGHSSLAYLKKFPIDTLKIDKSFIMEITNNIDDKVIVSTIITMAHLLGLKVVAEGVETLAHVELLKEMGCDQLQGYYFSKPIKADDFTKLIEDTLVF